MNKVSQYVLILRFSTNVKLDLRFQLMRSQCYRHRRIYFKIAIFPYTNLTYLTEKKYLFLLMLTDVLRVPYIDQV